MFWFTRVFTNPDWVTYSVRYRNPDVDIRIVGYVRRPINRAVANAHSISYKWSWKISPDEAEQWTLVNRAWNTRQACAEQLANAAGVATFPLRTRGDISRESGSPPRARRGTGRAFGIEIELTGPDALLIIQALHDAGVPVNPNNWSRLGATAYRRTNTNARHWALKRDGSVHGEGLELVSPKLRGQSGLDEVQTVCAVLNSINATVDTSCGLHVHHDMRGLTAEQIKTQALAFVDRENLIMQMVAPSRQHNMHCKLWSRRSSYYRNSLVNAPDDLSWFSRVAVGPRGTINLGAYRSHGSVEIRAHAGTTNAKKIIAWVRFGQALFAAAEAGAPISTSTTEFMLRDLLPYGLTPGDAAWLLRFQSAGSTRASVEARVLVLQEHIESVQSVLEEVS